jgi:hypothetical protein
MFSTILSAVTENFDKRFLMNVFFPTLLFSGFLIYLFYLGGEANALEAWNEQPIEIQAIKIIAFLSIVTFLAFLLNGHLTSILRFYEGYWDDQPFIGRFLGAKKRQYQLKQRIIGSKKWCFNMLQQLLDEKLEILCLQGGCKGSGCPSSDLESAERTLNVAEAKLIDARRLLKNAEEMTGAYHYKILPDLDGAEKILADQDGVEGKLIESWEQVKKAHAFLNKAKSEIILSHPEKGTALAAKAEEGLNDSARSIAALRAVFSSMKPRYISLEAKLKQAEEKITSLREFLHSIKGTPEDPLHLYFYLKKIESQSETMKAKIESVEGDLKEIDGVLLMLESLPQGAETHIGTAINSLKLAGEELSGIKVSQILEQLKKCSKSDKEQIEKEKADIISESQRIDQYAYYYFPPASLPQQVMATRLGNILKSAEVYSKERYNADAVFLWPKLYPLLSSETTTVLADARGFLDLMVLISFLSFIFSILGGLILVASRAQPIHFLLTFWGFLLLGWMAYKGAITAAVTYGDQIRSTFDLYRDKLIVEMGIKAPASVKDERELWEGLDQWLYRNLPSDKIIYSSNAPSTEAK